jgi:hypothetical protein
MDAWAAPLAGYTDSVSTQLATALCCPHLVTCAALQIYGPETSGDNIRSFATW